MLRRFAVLSALLVLLTGCVTTREVVYRDRYYDADGYVRRYDREVYRDGSYYSPALSGRGDYYYGRGYSGWNDSWYWDYPAYYSVFWPLYHRWYDPFFYPGYYYGVTYYPRHYFSIGFHGGWGWGGRYSHYYSPYRYSWADNYYDWTPWYRQSRRHERPRYGSARNEAERLARMGDFRRPRDAGYAQDPARAPFERYGAARGDARRADYGSVPAPRQEPGFRGFGVPQDAPRRVGAGEREAPVAAGFERRPAAAAPRGSWSAERAPSRAQQELGRWQGGGERGVPRDGGVSMRGPTYERRSDTDYGRMPARTSFGRPAGDALPAPRDYGQAAPRYEARREAVYAPRTEPRFEAQPQPRYEPRYEARPEPSYESRPEPRYESRPEPRYESRGDSGWSGGGRSSDDGEVRRVGSNRDE